MDRADPGAGEVSRAVSSLWCGFGSPVISRFHGRLFSFFCAMAPAVSKLQACPNASGECATEGCAATACPLWYGKKGNKICTPCYRQLAKRARQQAARSSRPNE